MDLVQAHENVEGPTGECRLFTSSRREADAK
jgi:hypothetical protein